MALFTWFRKKGEKGVDEAVRYVSGNTPPGPLDQNTIAFRVVLGIAVVALGFMTWTILRNINTLAKLPNSNKGNSANANENSQLAKLKNVDTDGDGLSDYDELYSYGSSPYLWSSAGDGISDGEKITRGLNPSCPINASCTLTNASVNTSTTNTSDNDTLTADFLRQALVAAGVSSSLVNQADDATLISLYQQAMAETAANINASSSTNNTNSVQTVEQFKNLTISEIRSLLIKNGVDATTLSKLDDDTVKAIFQQAVSSADSNTNS